MRRNNYKSIIEQGSIGDISTKLKEMLIEIQHKGTFKYDSKCNHLVFIYCFFDNNVYYN